MVGDQETRLSVGDRFREGADPGRDHGSSQGPRLEDRETLGLEQARQGERRTGREEGPFLPFGHDPEEPHAVFHPELAGSIPERVETAPRSEEHTSELQSPYDLVCRLLLEKKKHQTQTLT